MRAALPLVALLFTACAGSPDEAPAPDAPPAQTEALVPTAKLQVGGAEYTFYAWEDGSAGVLEAADPSIGSALEVAGFSEDVSMATVFWALSDPGDTVPEALLAHHTAMAEDAEVDVEPLELWGEQGWLADELVRFPPPPASYCKNSTFNSNICGSSTYPSGPGCFNNLTGSANWTTGATRRYRAGLCVQDGSVDGRLWYDEYTPDPSCDWTWRIYGGVWGTGTAYPGPHSNIYLNWWWIAPSDAPRRKWGHHASARPGGKYDWGTKFYATTNCSY